jgi:hypothetical protein
MQILVDGLILSLALSVMVLGSLYANPRLWLQDYPAEMRAKVPPLTRREKQARLVLVVLFFGVAIAGLYYSSLRLLDANGGSVTFLTAFLHIFLVLNIFNLFDAVVLDYLLLTRNTPRFVILPGTEGMEYLFHDSRMHIVNYLKGIVVCAILSIPAALIIAF